LALSWLDASEDNFCPQVSNPKLIRLKVDNAPDRKLPIRPNHNQRTAGKPSPAEKHGWLAEALPEAHKRVIRTEGEVIGGVHGLRSLPCAKKRAF
jgi:hypothetical protein